MAITLFTPDLLNITEDCRPGLKTTSLCDDLRFAGDDLHTDQSDIVVSIQATAEGVQFLVRRLRREDGQVAYTGGRTRRSLIAPFLRPR